MYIRKLRLQAFRDLKPITIPISSESKKHLIITGKNGAGKTTLIRKIYETFAQGIHTQWKHLFRQALEYDEAKHSDISVTKIAFDKLNKEFFNAPIILDVEGEIESDCFIIFFEANRKASSHKPSGIIKTELDIPLFSSPTLNQQFVQYLVNMWAEKSFAREDNDMDRVHEIDKWFNKLEKNLGELFEDSSLRLSFVRNEYNFNILQAGKQPYTFQELSDGQSSALSIVTELILRMESIGAKTAKIGKGIVIIDEIETHLHVSLQKKILPFLSDIFPSVQFVVTTHSPFVLTSTSNTCIFDMDRLEVFGDFSSYSYEAVLEDYFQVDKYSTAIKEEIKKIEELINNGKIDTAEQAIKSIYEASSNIESSIRMRAPELDLYLQRLLVSINMRRGDNDTH